MEYKQDSFSWLIMWKGSIKLFERYYFEAISPLPNEIRVVMTLPFAMDGTLWRCHHYAHALKTSRWHMPSTVEKMDSPTWDIMIFAIFLQFVKWFLSWCRDRTSFAATAREIFVLISTKTDDDDTRLDVKTNWLWESKFNNTYFDVNIFEPMAKKCLENSSKAYKYHEPIKKNKYDTKISWGWESNILSACVLMH